ncbi:cell division protein SepF [Catenisphaera adipataccumulans]|jgi:cell division inhibitor SepF|uniref:Cell division protein SepF n=1 Tax=Catenisphaera adipataccumulans TaxID=700500 RepID=A0A7W8CX52_9FIRM|nr:cell division protein SepF [Catenisphaera adipataccumulans]MBB5183237.1 cell division inhibitor SepF [Catenisphaera adipataccumulans]
MGFMDSIKSFVNPVDDDEEYENEEMEENENTQAAPVSNSDTTTRYERPKKSAPATLNANTKMVLFEPRGFGEVEEVGLRLKEGRAVVVNLHKLDRDYAQRTIDFLTGVVFALDGKIQKIGQNVILCSPAQIGVQGQISLGDPDDFDEE